MLYLPPRPQPLASSIKDFNIIKQIGQGAFGQVFKVTLKKNAGQVFAIKKVKSNLKIKLRRLSRNDIINIENEIDIHIKLNNKFVIRLLDFFQEDNAVFMILEYCSNGNLFNYLNRKRKLSTEEIKKFFFQTVLAIDYIHSNEIILRDLKPENILLDDEFNVKGKYYLINNILNYIWYNFLFSFSFLNKSIIYYYVYFKFKKNYFNYKSVILVGQLDMII